MSTMSLCEVCGMTKFDSYFSVSGEDLPGEFKATQDCTPRQIAELCKADPRYHNACGYCIRDTIQEQQAKVDGKLEQHRQKRMVLQQAVEAFQDLIWTKPRPKEMVDGKWVGDGLCRGCGVSWTGAREYLLEHLPGCKYVKLIKEVEDVRDRN